MIFDKIIFILFSTIIINNYLFVKPFDIINFLQFKSLTCKYCINNQLENFSANPFKDFSKVEPIDLLIIVSTRQKKIIPKYKYKLLKTSILNFLPFLKLHHIVLISSKNKIYSVDFSPINQSSPKTLLKLFFSKKVLAEIRIRVFENISLDNSNYYIIEKWSNLTKLKYNESLELSKTVFNEIDDVDLKNIIKKIKLYNTYMNLYNNNCQHFSKYVIQLLSSFVTSNS